VGVRFLSACGNAQAGIEPARKVAKKQGPDKSDPYSKINT